MAEAERMFICDHIGIWIGVDHCRIVIGCWTCGYGHLVVDEMNQPKLLIGHLHVLRFECIILSTWLCAHDNV